MRIRALWWMFWGIGGLLHCNSSPSKHTEPAAPPAVLPAPSASAPPPPPPVLQGERLQRLQVPGYGPATVVVPVGATTPRPVVVVTHGNFDHPDFQCKAWAPIVRGRAFVLCPRGVARRDSPSRDDIRFEYASLPALEKELEASLSALRSAFPDHVDSGPMVLAGFSLGALMNVFLAAKQPERFPRLVLIEGGDGWQQKTARSFQQGGGQRILFACGLPNCESAAKGAASTLRKAGVEVDLVRGSNTAHTYHGDVWKKYASRFSWLIEGDSRWNRSSSGGVGEGD